MLPDEAVGPSRRALVDESARRAVRMQRLAEEAKYTTAPTVSTHQPPRDYGAPRGVDRVRANGVSLYKYRVRKQSFRSGASGGHRVSSVVQQPVIDASAARGEAGLRRAVQDTDGVFVLGDQDHGPSPRPQRQPAVSREVLRSQPDLCPEALALSHTARSPPRLRTTSRLIPAKRSSIANSHRPTALGSHRAAV
jgi:hypothetical protein